MFFKACSYYYAKMVNDLKGAEKWVENNTSIIFVS